MAAELSPLESMRVSYGSVMRLPTDELWVVDFVASLALFAKVPNQGRDTCFGVIVGPSSCGKTALLKPYLEWPGFTLPYEDQTENGANSGSPTVTRTFLTDAHRRLVVCKEMTTLLTARPEKRAAFLSTIRAAADGSVSKRSGADDHQRNTKTRFTMICGVTDEYWKYQTELQDLGHRFLCYQMWRNMLSNRAFFRRLALDAALEGNPDKDKQIYAPLKLVVRSAFGRLRSAYSAGVSAVNPVRQKDEHDKDFEARRANLDEEVATKWDKTDFPLVTYTESDIWRFVVLSDIVTVARSGSYLEADALRKPDLMHRVQNQITDLVTFRALADLRVLPNDADMEFCRRICQDTIDPTRYAVLRLLFRATKEELKGYPLSVFLDTLNMDERACRNLLRHYISMGFAKERTATVGGIVGSGKSYRYALSDEYAALVKEVAFIPEAELEVPNAGNENRELPPLQTT